MNLGERIKQLRIALNMTRTQLSVALNIKYSTISNYENNVRQPDFDTLVLIAKYFGVDPNMLLDFNTTSEKACNNHTINLFITEAIKLPEKELVFFIKFLKFFNSN